MSYDVNSEMQTDIICFNVENFKLILFETVGGLSNPTQYN